MKKASFIFSNIQLNPIHVHKFRGYVGNIFKEYDLIHNHDLETGKEIYRYPLIQFKLIERLPVIIAVTERAVEIFKEIFFKMDEIIIENLKIPVYEKDLKIEDEDFGFSGDTFMYEFLSPWIGLNQQNYQRYMNSSDKNVRDEILKSTLTGNILSMSKGVGSWLDENQRIRTDIQVGDRIVKLKGKHMLGFRGIFKTNFLIPDYLGLGKSVSRGFGMVKKII